MNELERLKKENGRMRSALQVIKIWAQFDLDYQEQVALTAADVLAECDRGLK